MYNYKCNSHEWKKSWKKYLKDVQAPETTKEVLDFLASVGRCPERNFFRDVAELVNDGEDFDEAMWQYSDRLYGEYIFWWRCGAHITPEQMDHYFGWPEGSCNALDPTGEWDDICKPVITLRDLVRFASLFGVPVEYLLDKQIEVTEKSHLGNQYVHNSMRYLRSLPESKWEEYAEDNFWRCNYYKLSARKRNELAALAGYRRKNDPHYKYRPKSKVVPEVEYIAKRKPNPKVRYNCIFYPDDIELLISGGYLEKNEDGFYQPSGKAINGKLVEILDFAEYHLLLRKVEPDGTVRYYWYRG